MGWVWGGGGRRELESEREMKLGIERKRKPRERGGPNKSARTAPRHELEDLNLLRRRIALRARWVRMTLVGSTCQNRRART